MKVVEKLSDWIAIRNLLDQSVGFVPTMGALHQGHTSLVDRASQENEIVVMSIYLNPTQFDNADDLTSYPSSWEQDLELAEKAGVDFILAPRYEELYPLNYRYRVVETEFSKELCGQNRPGHFDGVLTVVMKLLNLAQADRAYFGEKDFQQLRLIEDMVKSFFMKTEIIGCPIVREEDGLAMSSRNRRLSQEERLVAAKFPEIISRPEKDQSVIAALSQAGFEVDYVRSINDRRFAAVKTGPKENPVRLIDNVSL